MKRTFTLSLILVLFSLLLQAKEWPAISPEMNATAQDSSAVQVAVEGDTLLLDALAIYGDVDAGKTVSEVLIATQPIFGEAFASVDTTLLQFFSEDFYQWVDDSPIDSFQFYLKYNDGSLSSDSVWVLIDSIVATNDVPMAFRDSFMVVQDSGAIYADVLKNDFDPDRAGLEVSIMTGGNVKHGILNFHSDAFAFKGDYLFFPNDERSPFNKNLLLPYDERDMSYLNDFVFTYEPNEGFYGYDSVTYIVSEYRPSDATYFQEYVYESVWNTDRDTATVIFYVEPHDFTPKAVNDTVYQLDASRYMKEVDVRTTEAYFPLANDIDGDTVPADPTDFLDIAYILADAADSAVATGDYDRVVFYHDIPQYEDGKLTYRKDSNIAYVSSSRDSVYYSYAADFCGVDSLFYAVIEQNLVGSDYPDYYRGDTSGLGLIYFVVEPVNDAPYTTPDTLDFNLAEAELLSGLEVSYRQPFDVLANDIDIDVISDATLSTLQRLMKDHYSNNFANYANVSIKAESSLNGSKLLTQVAASPGAARVVNDSVVYDYDFSYQDTYLIDSFKYYIYNGNSRVGSEWAFVRQSPLEAQNDTFNVSAPFVESVADGTIANNLWFTANDVSGDTLMVRYSGNNLFSPSKSDYAKILKAETGDVNYYYNKGFVEKDSFQYVVSNLFTSDTAWVFIVNEPCVAQNDTIWLSDNPFDKSYTDSYYDIIDILSNDDDAEGILNILPLSSESDTLQTAQGQISRVETSAGVEFKYDYKEEFFYKDSFVYWLTDVPVIYAQEGFFTRDSAWVIIEDIDLLADSDGDGIVNTMEDGIEGYQPGEELLDSDEDGIPNYLDIDADNDGFRDGEDCDGDGIYNVFDDDSGCNDIDVSTVFTPNGDGVNDYFEIPVLDLGDGEIVSATIRIYNRFGSLVYENTHYGYEEDWWDGTVGDIQGLSIGNELPNGVYLYYLEFNNASFKKEGFVHIQR